MVREGEGGLLTFFPWKGGLIRGEGTYLRGRWGLIEDLPYVLILLITGFVQSLEFLKKS